MLSNSTSTTASTAVRIAVGKFVIGLSKHVHHGNGVAHRCARIQIEHAFRLGLIVEIASLIAQCRETAVCD